MEVVDLAAQEAARVAEDAGVSLGSLCPQQTKGGLAVNSRVAWHGGEARPRFPLDMLCLSKVCKSLRPGDGFRCEAPENFWGIPFCGLIVWTGPAPGWVRGPPSPAGLKKKPEC